MQAVSQAIPSQIKGLQRPAIYFGREITYHERVFESFLEAIRVLPLFP
jgi:hypothetical protein